MDAETIQQIIRAQATIPLNQFVQGIIQRIIVQADSLEIELNVEEFCRAITEASGFKIETSKESGLIVGVYNTRRAKKSAIVIEPEKPDRDIFDLPPDQLKKLVQGIIWRDDHFSGMTLTDIAKREKCSDAYVGKCIIDGFKMF